MSKTKNTIPKKKNFKEKGTRDKENGSKPHSNGDSFSFDFKFFKPKIVNKI